MKHTLLLTFLAAGLLTGCSTMYKSGQTPDDVYYSPGRDIPTAREEVRQREQHDRYEDYISSQDDRYLRMKVANRSRWNSLDDFDYWYDSRYDFCPYYYNGYTGWNHYYGYGYSSWNNYYAWNHAWNYGLGYGGWRPYLGMGWGWSPVYTVISYGTPKFYNAPASGANISAYKNRSYNSTNLGYKDAKTGTWINNGSTNNFGTLMKRVFSTSPGNNNNTSSWERPVRTFDNNNASSSNSNTNSNAGGNSGGFKSTGSSASSGRGGRDN